jgi:hypothetical protein
MVENQRPPCIECKNYIGIDPDVNEHACSYSWERYDFVTGKTETNSYTQSCRSRRTFYLSAAEDCWVKK